MTGMRFDGVLAVSGVVVLLILAASVDARPLFTHSPTSLENVSGVIPLGNVSPSSHHILPVDHMYLQFTIPSTGTHSIPVHAMGAGKVVMVTRRASDGGGPEIHQLYIRHNRYVTSYVDYLYEITDRIRGELESTGTGWIDVRSPDFRVMIPGRNGAPAQFSVEAGEQLGNTRNLHTSWDIGVIDSRVTGKFLGRGVRRYPTVRDFLKTLGYRNIPNPYAGQETRNTASFIRYMTPALKRAWFNLLLSEPKRHGQAGWDLDGRLSGVWFNPAVDTAKPAPIFDLEYGAISISPYNLAPASRVQIAVAQGHPLSALDPTAQYPQLGRAIVVDMDTSRGARVNPDPAKVSMKTGTVCYDVAYSNGGAVRFNTLLFNMTGRRRVAIKFDATPGDFSKCTEAISSRPDATWVVYHR